jgi:dienelactone hydrolase
MKQTIHFLSQGEKCTAWWFQPTSQAPAPVIVMAHGLGGIKEMGLEHHAQEFVAAGYACLLFDYRHFGESDGEPRQLLDIQKQLEDWNAAVEYARHLPDIDPTKIILWGTSLSGGHVIKTAAANADVAAVIAQMPHLSGIASVRLNSLSKMLALSIHGGYDLARKTAGLTPHYLPSSAEPDELAILNAPGESKGYLKLVPNPNAFDRRIAARFAFHIGLYSPVRQLHKLAMPVLIQVGNYDITTPAKPALKYIGKYPNIKVKTYNTGHFQPYVEPMFSFVVGDQLAFLEETVPSTPILSTKANAV